MPASFTGTPALIASHIYDPQTRVSTLLNPYSRLARDATIFQVAAGYKLVDENPPDAPRGE